MKKKRRLRPEQAIQSAVFQHIRQRMCPRAFAFHVPNGGKRSAIEASIFKGLGVVAGVPDIIIVREGQMYALELKAGGGRLTRTQIECLEQMEAAGAICHVAYGLDPALAWLEEKRILRGRAA